MQDKKPEPTKVGKIPEHLVPDGQQPGMPPMGAKNETIRIIPFKAKRDKKFMPFQVGQGVSLAGWQFSVAACLPNGNVVLKPQGKILTPELEKALNSEMAKRVKELNYSEGAAPKPQPKQPPVYNPAEVEDAKKPDAD